jgi:pimeloyl-ACP methyl ester carboxylesterase
VTTATVEGAGVELAYDERGSGEPVVLVHATASTRATWAEVRDELGEEVRTIAYDRRAYGESGAPEGYTATSVEEHGDDLIALLRALELTPALLCGHGFGAMACLDVVVREPELVRGAVLIEPPMLWLASEGAEAASALRAEIEAGAAENGSAGAIAAFMRVLCGPQALDVLGRERAAAALRHPVAFGADLGAAANWSVPPRALREVGRPVVLVTGTRTPAAHREPGEVLARMIPHAELRECDSGHLVPNEAPDVVADAVRSLAQP